MKTKTASPRRYFAVLKGVRLPWFIILLSMVFSVATTRTELEVATLTAGVIDSSQNSIDAEQLLRYLGTVVIAGALSILSYYFTRRMEEDINLGVRVRLWKKIMGLPTAYYDADNGNELVSRVTSDAEAPSSLFSVAVSFVTCVVTTVQGFMRLFAYNRLLATYSLGIIPLTMLICLLYGKLMFRLGVYSTTTMAGSLGYLAERVRNFRLIKSAVAERLESEKGGKTFKEMYKAEFLSWLMVAGYQLASGLFSILFIVIVFVIGGQLIGKGEVTVGDLTGFYMISGTVSMQLMQFFMNVGSVAGTFGTMKKISEVAVADTEPQGGEPVPPLCADLVLDDVHFSYDGENEVLKGVTARIPMGKVTAIIGGNGAGKSTLFKLLTRLYEPDSGTIRFGDTDVRRFSLAGWRRRFAVVFQREPLIGGTVRENLTFGAERPIGDEELTEAAKQANCYAAIMQKPAGFDEDVGLNGSNFSGGQGQCISVARAMLRGADYLLLDEATSDLDAVSEAQVTQALDNLMRNKTTVMIAHNYAAIRSAEYILVMKDGIVEAAGTPEELEQTSEFYRLFSQTL